MDRTEKYNNLKRTLEEVTKQDMCIVFIRSDGSKIPSGRSVERQEYIISFSNRARGLLLSTEAVAFGLEENLGKIKESIRYFARQKIEGYLKEAKQERQSQLNSLEEEKINVVVEI